MHDRTRVTVFLAVFAFLTLAAQPAKAARKPLKHLTTSASTEAGEAFVLQIAPLEKSRTFALESQFSRSAVSTIYVSQVDESRGTYKADRSKVSLKPDPEAGDRLLTVSLLIVAPPELRSKVDPASWRKLVENVLRSAAKQGTTLKFADGSTTRAMFGPDGNLLHFRHTTWYYRTNEANQVIIRQYIGEPKDQYLAEVGLTGALGTQLLFSVFNRGPCRPC